MSWLFHFYVFLWIALTTVSDLIAAKRTTARTTNAEIIPTYNSVCSDLTNVSIVSPQKHLYSECMPMIFGRKKGDDLVESDAPYLYSLMEAPFSDETKSKFNVALNDVQLMSFAVIDTNDLKPDVQIKLGVSWQDDRLRWDPAKWRFDTYPVQLTPLLEIWGPIFKVNKASIISPTVNEVTFSSSKLSSNGSVAATYFAQIALSKCTTDLAAYPYDFMTCCTDMNVLPENRISLNLNALTTSLEFLSPTRIWSINKLDVKPKNNGADLCIFAKRNAAAIGAELSLPMAVSAIVAMCAQLAGKWKMQMYTKLFAILIQTFAFLNLLPNNSLMNVTRLPRIYIFFNFTLAVTMFSLVQTMLFWALSRRWFLMPPPHRLTLSTKMISRVLLGNKIDQVSNVDNVADHDQLESKKENNRKEWETVFGTIHAMLSLLIVFVYIIGIIVIYAL